MDSELLGSTVPLEIEPYAADTGFQPVPGVRPSQLTYNPMFIRQRADYNFGETVTHEDYNAKFNIVAESLDYYAQALFNLFNQPDPELAYHVPYLDAAIDDLANATNREVNRLDDRITNETARLDGRIDDVWKTVNKHTEQITNIFTQLDDHEKRLKGIVDGSIIVGHAAKADKITGVENVGPYHYYGTDKKRNVGFHEMPPAIYADYVGENPFVNPRDVDGIYYVPGSDSVSESMLTPELRDKINEEGITKYPQLGELPQINSVTLLGNRTLADLGIQPAGKYLTSVPAEYVQRSELGSYYTKTQVDNLVNGASSSGSSAASSVRTELNNFKSTVASTYNRIGVNTKVSNPIKGDLYVVV